MHSGAVYGRITELISKGESKMRRVISILIAVILTAAMLLPMGALAEAEAVFKLDNVDNANPGDEIVVVVHLSGNYKAHVANILFEYDTSALEVVSVEQTEECAEKIQNASGICYIDYETLAGQGRIPVGIVMPTDPLQGDFEFIKLKFRVKADVKVNQEVTLYIAEFAYMPIDSDTATNIHCTVENAVISITGASDPEDGFTGTTTGYPQGQVTPIPGSSDVPVVTSVPSTAEPDGTDAVGEKTSEPEATKGPGSEPSSTANANDGKTDRNGASPLVYVLVGVAIVCAGAAIIFVTKGKKTKED